MKVNILEKEEKCAGTKPNLFSYSGNAAYRALQTNPMNGDEVHPYEMTPTDDAAAVRRCLAGEIEAFGLLVEKYERKLYAMAYGYVRNREDARDLTQEAFIRAYCNLSTLMDHTKFAQWLGKTLSHVCTDWLRDPRSKMELIDFQPSGGSTPTATAEKSPLDKMIEKEEWEEIMSSIRALPTHYRLAFMMRYMEGLSYKEIAELLDVPLTTVEGRLHKAKVILRKFLSFNPLQITS